MLSRYFPILITLIIFADPASAVDILKCEDNQGNITFQDRCPPGTKAVEKKAYRTTAPTAGSAVTREALTVYLVPGCDTCAQLKEFLSVRNLQYTEKDVSEDVNLQNELKEVAGELQVPVLLVGDKVLSGYNRSALLQALTESGHIAATAE